MRNIVTRFGVIDAENQISALLLAEQQIEDLWKSSQSTQEDVDNLREWIRYLREDNEYLKEENVALKEDNTQFRDEVRKIKVVTGEHLSEIFIRLGTLERRVDEITIQMWYLKIE